MEDDHWLRTEVNDQLLKRGHPVGRSEVLRCEELEPLIQCDPSFTTVRVILPSLGCQVEMLAIPQSNMLIEGPITAQNQRICRHSIVTATASYQQFPCPGQLFGVASA